MCRASRHSLTRQVGGSGSAKLESNWLTVVAVRSQTAGIQSRVTFHPERGCEDVFETGAGSSSRTGCLRLLTQAKSTGKKPGGTKRRALERGTTYRAFRRLAGSESKQWKDMQRTEHLQRLPHGLLVAHPLCGIWVCTILDTLHVLLGSAVVSRATDDLHTCHLDHRELLDPCECYNVYILKARQHTVRIMPPKRTGT